MTNYSMFHDFVRGLTEEGLYRHFCLQCGLSIVTPNSDVSPTYLIEICSERMSTL